jgi:hypothetical protein
MYVPETGVTTLSFLELEVRFGLGSLGHLPPAHGPRRCAYTVECVVRAEDVQLRKLQVSVCVWSQPTHAVDDRTLPAPVSSVAQLVTLPCEAWEGGGWGTVSWENDESLFLSLYLSHAVYTLQQQMEKLPSRGGVCVCSSETSWRCIWNTLLRGSVHGESGTVGVIESTGGAGVGRQVVFTSDVLHVCMSTASLTGHGCQFMLGDARIQVGVVQRVRGQVHAAHVCPNRRS